MPPHATADARYLVIARMKPGDTREALASRLASLTPQVASGTSGRETGWGISLVGMGPRSVINSQLQPGVLMLVAATGLALLVACANVAMVMVARGAARQKETAVRSALGAARGRLVRQFLTESIIVSLAGGGLALVIAFGAMQLIVANAPMDLTVAINVHMDWRVVAAVGALSLTVGMLAGLAPALADSRVNLVAALKETGFFSAGYSRARLRRTLIVVEVALTVMLVACVSLLVRGVFDLEGTNPGFDPKHLLRVRIDGVQHLGRESSREPDFRTTLDLVRHVRGVKSAAAALVTLSGETRRAAVGPRIGDQADELARVLVFVPFKNSLHDLPKLRSLTLLVRVEPGPDDVVSHLRRAVAEADPLQPVQVTSVEEILEVGLQEVRVSVYLAAPLMLLALLLTVSGIYGLLAQSVAQRTHELAVRVTLGAGRNHLLRLVARDGLVLAGMGATAGIAAAWMLDQSLSAFLFGVPGEEPIALAGSGLLMMLITLVACLAPYRRAIRIDPGRTLRYE